MSGAFHASLAGVTAFDLKRSFREGLAFESSKLNLMHVGL